MAYDETTTLDPVHGFAVNDQNLIIGLHQMPLATSPQGEEWPKWVEVHDSQINRREIDGLPTHISTPGWENHHVDRNTGKVSVLVSNDGEAQRAAGEYRAVDPADQAQQPNSALRREVHLDVEAQKRADADALSRRIAAEQGELENEEALRRANERRDFVANEQQSAADIAHTQRDRAGELAGSDQGGSQYPRGSGQGNQNQAYEGQAFPGQTNRTPSDPYRVGTPDGLANKYVQTGPMGGAGVANQGQTYQGQVSQGQATLPGNDPYRVGTTDGSANKFVQTDHDRAGDLAGRASDQGGTPTERQYNRGPAVGSGDDPYRGGSPAGSNKYGKTEHDRLTDLPTR